MSLKVLRLLLVLLVPIGLAACGDNYEAVKTDSAFPYGNKRTAGSGIEYVRKNMMPKKALKVKEDLPVLEEASSDVKTAPVQDDVLKNLENDMDAIFEQAQRK